MGDRYLACRRALQNDPATLLAFVWTDDNTVIDSLTTYGDAPTKRFAAADYRLDGSRDLADTFDATHQEPVDFYEKI